jgi:hypothetical protein
MMTENREAADLIDQAQVALHEAKGLLMGKPSSREGKVHIAAYLPAEFKTKIRMAQAFTGLDLEATLADTPNLYFLSRNVPAVDSRYALPPTKNGKGRTA